MGGFLFRIEVGSQELEILEKLISPVTERVTLRAAPRAELSGFRQDWRHLYLVEETKTGLRNRNPGG
jgi:hypothetical protein